MKPSRKTTRRKLQRLAHSAGSGSVALPIFLAASAISFGVVGWSIAIFDGTFRSFVEIVTKVVASFLPSGHSEVVGNWATQTGALFASLATVIGGIILGLSTAGEQLTKAAARYLWSHHIIIIGDTPLTRRIAEATQLRGERVFHVVPLDGPKFLPVGPIRVRLGTDGTSVRSIVEQHFAKQIIVDIGTDAATLSVARTILEISQEPLSTIPFFCRTFRKPPKDKPQIALKISDPILADRITETAISLARSDNEIAEIAPRPIIFDENRALARFTLAQHPLFPIAAERHQPRVHAVIVGFGRLGEHLMDQVMLTSIAGDLGVPQISIIDRSAKSREREFRARRPAVLDSLDIAFFEFDFETESFNRETVGSHLLDRLEINPATGIFIALPTDEDVLRTSLMINRIQKEEGYLEAPIFYRSRLIEDEPDMLDGLSYKTQISDRFIRMRMPISIILREISDPGGRDALANILHTKYLEGQNISDKESMQWENLSESLRRANIRAADHVPAKLWTLGIEADSSEIGEPPRLKSHDLEKLKMVLAHPSPLLERLAHLEHDRWAVERKLEGWTWGEKRNDTRRIHPLLISWEQLSKSPSDVAKDLDQITGVLSFVIRNQA